ncbi:hypothetical protein [Desertibaculum subflavum]|uniref:hypothetical protein n=1 Tax=Desertibaculum subflavum TaxID=2268458 RepID=UPI000E672C93
MAAASMEELGALLRETLAVWHLEGEVRLDAQEIEVAAAGRRLHIVAAPGDVLFPWLVRTAEKSRGVASVAALLRTVRNALDPEHGGVRLRLAPRGVLPP